MWVSFFCTCLYNVTDSLWMIDSKFEFKVRFSPNHVSRKRFWLFHGSRSISVSRIHGRFFAKSRFTEQIFAVSRITEDIGITDSRTKNRQFTDSRKIHGRKMAYHGFTEPSSPPPVDTRSTRYAVFFVKYMISDASKACCKLDWGCRIYNLHVVHGFRSSRA